MATDIENALDPVRARALINAIRSSEDGIVEVSDHAVEEMEKDDLDMMDALNVVRCGRVQPAEWEGGEWRYRVLTERMGFVVSFQSEKKLTIVTGWRNK